MALPSRVLQATLWRNGDFVRLWLAGGVSGIGARITREGLPLMAVLLLHATPREIGVLAAARAAPSLLAGLLLGGWVDRVRRRRILIGADFARAALLLIIPGAALTHHLQIALVYLIGALVGGLSSLYDMADHAYLPSLVSREELVGANSALGGVEAVAEIGGPAFAGGLFSVLLAPLALAVNSLTYLASGVILLSIRRSEPRGAPDAEDSEGVAELGRGVTMAWRLAEIRPLLLLVLTSVLFGSFFSALYIPFAVTTLRLTPAMLGLTIAVGGIGALAGAALSPWLARRVGLGPALILSGVLAALFNLFIPFAGGPPARGMAMLMAAQFLGDAAGTAMYIYIASIRQGLLPQASLGRIAGAFAAATGLASILGALGGGALTAALGERTVLIIACLGQAAAPLWCLASPLRQLRTLPESGAA